MDVIKFEDVTPELITKWKEEYGYKSIRQIDVEYNGDTISYIIKLPELDTMDSLSEQTFSSEQLMPTGVAAAMQLIKNLYDATIIAGDIVQLENWEIGQVVLNEIQNMFVDFADEISDYVE